MDFRYLFTKTDGRISRKTWWIGALLLVIANVAVSLLILPLVGLGGPNITAIMAAQSDPAQVSTLILGALQVSAWASLVVFLIFAYPVYCLSVKRRHDKNNDGRDLLIYFAAMIVLLLLQGFGLAFTIETVNSIPMPAPTLLCSILGVIVGIFGIYMLVVLGFLKGTEGANSYGPDPLTSGSVATA